MTMLAVVVAAQKPCPTTEAGQCEEAVLLQSTVGKQNETYRSSRRRRSPPSALGEACADGDNDNCQGGLVCGKFNNDPDSYQCCSSFQVYDGAAWCTNPEGGSCSCIIQNPDDDLGCTGIDQNCQGDLKCGEVDNGYPNNNGHLYTRAFQCCPNVKIEFGRRWCASPEGGPCYSSVYDNVDKSCQPGLACGKLWSDYNDDPTVGQAGGDYCCSIYFVDSHGWKWCAGSQGDECPLNADGSYVKHSCLPGLGCGCGGPNNTDCICRPGFGDDR